MLSTGTLLDAHPIEQLSRTLFKKLKQLNLNYIIADFNAVDPPAVRISADCHGTEVATYVDVDNLNVFQEEDMHNTIYNGLKQAMINNKLEVEEIIEIEANKPE